MPGKLIIDRNWIASFCPRHHIKRLAIFGSALREDFRPESDIDVLVEFAPGAQVSLFDFVRMQEELSHFFGRDVDLVEERGIRNPFRRREILSTAETLYAA